MLVKHGSFAAITSGGSPSAGDQAITGLGFQPKAIIFYSTGETTDDGSSALAAVASVMYGMTAGSTQNAVFCHAVVEGANPAVAGKAWNETACIEFLSNGVPTTDGIAALKSFDADGFTINWSAFPGSARLVKFIALGGSDITNAKVGFFASNSSLGVGTQSITGVGFTPDFLMFLGGDMTAAGTASNSAWCVGAASGTAAGRQFFVYDVDNAGGASMQYTSSGKCIVGGTGSRSGSLASFNADGFSISWNPDPGSALRFGYLALKGGNYFVGNETQGTSTGNKATTGVGFLPAGALYISGAAEAGSGGGISFGGASSSTARGAISYGRFDSPTAHARSDRRSTRALWFLFVNSLSAVSTGGNADLVTFDSDGFTLNWITSDATARVFNYIAFGPAASAATYTDAGTVTLSLTPSAAETYLPNIREEMTNLAKSTLNGGITSSAVTLTVVDGSKFPTRGFFRVVVDPDGVSPEIIRCSGRAGNVISVDTGGRGDGGTSPSSWNSGTLVVHSITVESLDARIKDTLALNIVPRSSAHVAGYRELVLANATGGAFTVTLPSALAQAGKTVVVKRMNSGANNVTVAAAGSETIDGAATFALTTQYEVVRLVSDGSVWVKV